MLIVIRPFDQLYYDVNHHFTNVLVRVYDHLCSGSSIVDPINMQSMFV
jgi:hypothetical protein